MTWWRAWGPWVVFTLAGPPLGFASLLLAGFVVNALSVGFIHAWPRATSFHEALGALMFLAQLSLGAYVFGGFQATLVGLVAALSRTREGYPSLVAPLAVATCLSVGMTAFTLRGGGGGEWMSALALWLIPHCGSTFLCWLLVRRLRSRTDDATELA